MRCFDAAREYYKRTWDSEEGLLALPEEWQRELVAILLASDDINNGGYLQFLTNHGRVAYEYASRALKRIGAHKTAECIDNCQALVDEHFPSKGKTSRELTPLLPNAILSREGKQLKKSGSVLPTRVLDRLSALSYEFMSFPDDYGIMADEYYRNCVDANENGQK